MSWVVGVDIGGTKTVAGLVSNTGEVLNSIFVPTPTHDADAIVATVVECINTVGETHKPHAIGIGVAGLIDVTGRNVAFAPHLAFVDFPLAQRIEEQTQVPCVIENDATATAWAEYRVGSGHGVHSLLAVTVGTGLGGGVVVNDTLMRGAHGTAGEVGHIPWVLDGVLCACGARGCLEQYASGSALTRHAREFVASGHLDAQPLLAACDGDIDQLTGNLVTQLALAGDHACMALIADIGTTLGAGLSAMVAVVDPALVVVGGGVSAAGELLLQPARLALEQRLIGGAHRPVPPVVKAQCGELAAMVGAGLLAHESVI